MAHDRGCRKMLFRDGRFRPNCGPSGCLKQRGVSEDKAFDYSSSSVPSGALFVVADEPLLVYPSVAAAQRHLEAIDVDDGVYPIAYGAHGEVYRIRTEENRVIIELTGESSQLDELRSLLVSYLEATGSAPSATASFDDLIDTVWRIESDFWQEYDPYGERFGTRIPLWGCIGFVVAIAGVLYLIFR